MWIQIIRLNLCPEKIFEGTSPPLSQSFSSNYVPILLYTVVEEKSCYYKIKFYIIWGKYDF